MAELITGLDAGRVRENLARVREDIAAAAKRAGRDPGDVELCVATKYVAVAELPVLAEAGLTLLGENRSQDLEVKVASHPGDFTWDFIGHLQSRKVKQVLPHVRLIHSVGSNSVLGRLEQHADLARPGLEVLLEVNVAGEEAKSGISPAEVASYMERCTFPVTGLMTMPPLADDPEKSRPVFGALAELAAEHGLRRLSMGTTQDFAVAVEEGATLVRVGSVLFR